MSILQLNLFLTKIRGFVLMYLCEALWACKYPKEVFEVVSCSRLIQSDADVLVAKVSQVDSHLCGPVSDLGNVKPWLNLEGVKEQAVLNDVAGLGETLG